MKASYGFMKMIFILILLALAQTILFGDDQTREQTKKNSAFPGIFDFSFITGGGSDIANSKAAPSYYDYPSGAVYGRITILGGLKIPIKFYSFKLWGKDEVYIIGLSSDTGTSGKLDLNNQVRNRFFAGVDNYFAIGDIINIGVNFESRIQAKVALSTGIPDEVETRLSPALDLNGSYDFGFTWGITEAFRLYLIPQNDASNELQKIQFDGAYFMGYEFLHFFKLENISGQVYTELDLAVDRFTAKDLYPLNDSSNKTRIWWLEYYAGINFNIYGFTPSVGFDMTYDTTDTGTYPKGLLFCGIKTGLGYAKDAYSFTITYVGNITSDGDYSSIIYRSKSPVWENHIDASFAISL